jgi:pyrimidine-nucleoside phosphorylase
MIGQTPELVPADRKLYALRDVTATVPSIPLIAASIMSKKLAEGTDSLVLDVKWGKGAFMKELEDAQILAETMVAIGKRIKKGMVAVLSNMNQPLGHSAGNAVEVVEAIETLHGKGPDDLMNLTLLLGAHMLILGKVARNQEKAMVILRKKLQSGTAFSKFREMIKLQGGDVEYIDNPQKLPSARYKMPYPAPRSGYVSDVDADLIGRACIILGAGRKTVDDRIDHAAGITGMVKIGDKIKKGQPLLVIHANDRNMLAEAKALAGRSVKIINKHIRPPRLIAGVIY